MQTRTRTHTHTQHAHMNFYALRSVCFCQLQSYLSPSPNKAHTTGASFSLCVVFTCFCTLAPPNGNVS